MENERKESCRVRGERERQREVRERERERGGGVQREGERDTFTCQTRGKLKVLTTFWVRAIVSSRFKTVCHHPPKHRERERGERERGEREIQDGMPPPT